MVGCVPTVIVIIVCIANLQIHEALDKKTFLQLTHMFKVKPATEHQGGFQQF